MGAVLFFRDPAPKLPIAFCNLPHPSPVYKLNDSSSLPGSTKPNYQPSQRESPGDLPAQPAPARGPSYFLACQKNYSAYTSGIAQPYQP